MHDRNSRCAAGQTDDVDPERGSPGPMDISSPMHKTANKKMLNKKILIVDDDERFLRALVKILRSEGASVTATQWAVDAMDALSHRKQLFDLVITDLRMPLVHGGMLVRSIRMLSPDLPIIVLTAFGGQETREELRRQGATAFLEKSLDSSELLAEIQKSFRSESPTPGPSDPPL